jgi:hypothetical protein
LGLNGAGFLYPAFESGCELVPGFESGCELVPGCSGFDSGFDPLDDRCFESGCPGFDSGFDGLHDAPGCLQTRRRWDVNPSPGDPDLGFDEPFALRRRRVHPELPHEYRFGFGHEYRFGFALGFDLGWLKGPNATSGSKV